MTELNLPEIKEGGPRYKVLVIQLNPGASPEKEIAQGLWGKTEEGEQEAEFL